jgi:hypothetical protein
MRNRNMKRCSTSLTREMQIKTTTSCHLTPGRMTVIKNTRESIQKSEEKRKPDVNWYSHYGKQYRGSSKKL